MRSVFFRSQQKSEATGLEHRRSSPTTALALSKSQNVLIKLFQKFARSRASSPWRPPQRAKLPFSAFLFVNFFFAPMVSKKKWLRRFCYLINCIFTRFSSRLRGQQDLNSAQTAAFVSLKSRLRFRRYSICLPTSSAFCGFPQNRKWRCRLRSVARTNTGAFALLLGQQDLNSAQTASFVSLKFRFRFRRYSICLPTSSAFLRFSAKPQMEV